MRAVHPLDEELRPAVEATVRRFCREAVVPEWSPADLVAQAREAGLLPDGFGPAEAEGLPGLWGPGALEWGAGPALEALAAVAERDGAAAVVLHLAGLAVLVWPGVPLPATLALDATFAEAALEDGGAHGDAANGAGGDDDRTDARLVPWPRGLRTVLLATAGGWRAAAPEDVAMAPSPVGPTLGLRGLPFVDLRVSPDAGTALPRPFDVPTSVVVSLHLLGLAAIGLGRARRALARAVAYAADRRQGGRLLRDQPVVQSLVGEAVEAIATLEALLDRAASLPVEAPELAGLAPVAKTAGLAAAARAATNALQVLGGYGYMEDEPMAGVLRDCETLRTMHGRPARLTRLTGLRRLGAEAGGAS